MAVHSALPLEFSGSRPATVFWKTTKFVEKLVPRSGLDVQIRQTRVKHANSAANFAQYQEVKSKRVRQPEKTGLFR